jgi:tRNA (adenine22-N1)-methyltransferase
MSRSPDQRLQAAIKMIRSEVHADIGSDHGLMLFSMLKSGRIERGIAIENKRQPFENSVATLAGLNAEVRLGDGLAALQTGEADSLSICGMGGPKMRQLLQRFPDRLPKQVVVQPNERPELLREWGLNQGFYLVDEQLVVRRNCRFTILNFHQANGNDPDPAYADIDRTVGLEFGPWFLKRRESQFVEMLMEEEAYWNRFERLEPERQQRVELIRMALSRWR